MNAAILVFMDTKKCAYLRTPTADEVTELALRLAKEDGVKDYQRRSLIYRPTWVPPPEPHLAIHMPWAKEMRKRAEDILIEQMNPQLYKKRPQKPAPAPVTARTETGRGLLFLAESLAPPPRFLSWRIREGPLIGFSGGPRRGALCRRDPGNTLRNQ